MKLKFVIIGCGRISYKHIDAITDNKDNAILFGLCDVKIERANDRNAQYQKQGGDNKVIITDNYLEILNKDFDVAVISTESGYHFEHAKACIESGKHIIIEKPMAMNEKDCLELVELAKQHNTKICISHQNRFNKTIQMVKKAIEDKRFGKIYAINARILWNRNQDYYTQAPWRGTHELDGGCLMNQCIHNIDLLQWLMGSEVVKVNAMLENYAHDYIEAEDYGSIQIRFENGSIGNVEGTVLVYPKNLKETLTILGEKGTVEVGGLALNEIDTWQFADNIDTIEDVKKVCDTKIDSVYGGGHSLLYNDFIKAIKNDTVPLIDGLSGSKAVAIIEKAYSQR